MHDIFNDEKTHGIVQVDANNAFNTINRNVFLHNISIICPEIATYVTNCYQKPARLFVIGGIELSSEEGTTQGDMGVGAGGAPGARAPHFSPKYVWGPYQAPKGW